MTEQPDLEALYPEPVVASEVLGQYERILLFGEGGTGKTHIAGTAPEPQWWLTPGGKNELKTIFGKNFIEKHGKKEKYISSVKEARIKGQMQDDPTGYDEICDRIDAFLEWNYAKNIGVQTIIVDNATVLEEYMMNKAIMAEYHLASGKTKTTLHREREYGIRRPGDNTYGGAQSFMDRFLNWLVELDFHLVFVAHEYSNYKSEDDNSRNRVLTSVKPLFVGAQRTSVPNKFDNVWLTEASGGGRGVTYGMRTVRDEIYYAKTRVSGILEVYERNPNLTDIIGEFSQYAKEQDEAA